MSPSLEATRKKQKTQALDAKNKFFASRPAARPAAFASSSLCPSVFARLQASWYALECAFFMRRLVSSTGSGFFVFGGVFFSEPAAFSFGLGVLAGPAAAAGFRCFLSGVSTTSDAAAGRFMAFFAFALVLVPELFSAKAFWPLGFGGSGRCEFAKASNCLSSSEPSTNSVKADVAPSCFESQAPTHKLTPELGTVCLRLGGTALHATKPWEIHNVLGPLFLLHGFSVNRKSSILDVWAALGG